ncbi:MAG TPA: hypothetical protein VF532_12850 [Candidatus Angelobacter sp.]
MNHDDGVLNRVGARELTQAEANKVQGGFRTLTVCTHCNGQKDKDIGEC